MVIKTLIEAWRSHAAIRHMYDEFMEMLRATEHMFHLIGQILFDDVDTAVVADDIFATDIRVNKTERKIRRQIVEHLTVHPAGDVPACLVLMSIVKDAERIGDYCKNLFEVRALLGKEISRDVMPEEVHRVYARVREAFELTRRAIGRCDEKAARTVADAGKRFAHELDEKVAAIATSDLPARVAVPRALAYRHMKRIHAHLVNISTSLVQPVHKLDYLDEGSPRPPKG